MKKRMLLLLAAIAAVGLTACGGEEPVATQEVDYDMTFANETGIDVTKLEIRYAADAEWSEITLSGGIWENNYEIPVSMEGQMPVAEDGWQVQMTFGDSGIQKVWEGIDFADDTIFTFTLADGAPAYEVSVEAAEGNAEEAEAQGGENMEK